MNKILNHNIAIKCCKVHCKIKMVKPIVGQDNALNIKMLLA